VSATFKDVPGQILGATCDCTQRLLIFLLADERRAI
jgi:alpha-D-ribose 1-methylphosphonate 5-triphosphate synthase subunit PhnI